MLTELHCPRGHRQPIKPAELEAEVRCKECQIGLSFRPAGGGSDETRWLIVGGRTGPPRLAVPIPIGPPLKIGAGPDGWLVLPGDDVAEAHAELTLQADMRLTVRHLSGDGGTWVNRAKIISGVVNEEDTLRVGAFFMRLRTQAALAAVDGADVPDVVVVEEEGGVDETYDDVETIASFKRPYEPSERSIGQKARRLVSVLVILGAGVYLARALIGPGVSPEMPQDTEYHCPVDGTVFRASWSVGTPKCPNCGQLCFGSMGHRPKPIERPTTSSASTEPETHSPKPPAPPGRPGAGGSP